MNAIESHLAAVEWSKTLLDLTMEGVSDEALAWLPPGKAHSVAASYAHALAGTDAIVHTLLQGEPPLYESTWRGRTGISEPQWNQDEQWAGRVTVDMEEAARYEDAVFAAASELLHGLKDSDLDREVDLNSQGLGTRSLDWCVSALISAHVHNMAGEIAAVKGAQGLAGYPF